MEKRVENYVEHRCMWVFIGLAANTMVLDSLCGKGYLQY